MKAIDFRIRPPYDSFQGIFKQIPPGLQKNYACMGIDDPLPKSYQQDSIEVYLKECDAVDIVASVIASNRSANHAAMEALTLQYPSKFYYFPYVTPSDLDGTKATVERYIKNGKGYVKGVTMQPGDPIDGKYYQVNEQTFFPVYQYLEENGIPVLMTLALLTVPYYDNNIPYYLDQVLAAFPKLKVILGHGGWPWVRDFCAITTKRPNLYLIMDTQLYRGAGHQDYAETLNYWSPDQFIFGSSYPVSNPAVIKKYYEKSDVVQQRHLENFFYNNAARILGL